MKNTFKLKLLIFTLAICSVLFCVVGCGHVHDYAELKFNETGHWYECVCGEKQDAENHKGGTATCTEQATCSVCNEKYGDKLGNHEYNVLSKDATSHWYECVCGEKQAAENHKGGTATCTEQAECSVCNEKYGDLEKHNYTELKENETEHWLKCVCGDKKDVESHKGGTATCTEQAKCLVCNQKYGDLEEHNYNALKKNETEHWLECVCGDKKDVESHKGGTATYTELAVCSICNSEYGKLLERPATEGLVFTLNNEETEYSVTGYNGSSTEIYIPSTYNEKPVTSIGNFAFMDKSAITSVEMPKSIISIGVYAFRSTSIQSIEIFDNVSLIDSYAFMYCTSLKNVAILSYETRINLHAFMGCEAIEYVNIPISMISMIPKTSLKKVVINSGSQIGDNAFAGCTLLESIEILSNITRIGGSAFSECSSLEKIEIPNGVTNISSSAFFGCKSLIDVKIPDSVTTIGGYAFSGCKALTNIILPSGVTEIGYAAFSNCSSLKNIEIPKGVTSISELLFSNCSSLENIDIVDTITIIGPSAFKNCSSLTNVKIGKGITSISSFMFSGCSSLESIDIPSNVTTIEHNAFNGCSSLTSFVINDNVTSLGQSVFSGCSSLKNITIGNGISSLDNTLFANCSSLTSIEIPSNITSIALGVFKGCSSLEKITLPFIGSKAGVTNKDTYQYPLGYIFGTNSFTNGVETRQFFYEKNLKEHTNTTYYIPASLTTVKVTGSNILFGAFSNCKYIKNIELPEGTTSIGASAFSGCTSLINIENFSEVVDLGASAFFACESLENLALGNEIRVVNDYTFKNCSKLTNIQIPTEILEISITAFENCVSLKYNETGNARYLGNNENKYVYLVEASSKTITNVKISDSCKIIKKSAFSSCDLLTSVEVPNSVISIGEYAFYGCTALQNLTIPFVGGASKVSKTEGTKLYFGYIFGLSSYIYGYNKNVPSSLKTVVITDKCTIIENAFKDCSSIKSIIIGDGVTSIGDSAFSNCSSLISVKIGNGVTSIGNSAFSSCSSLISATIGNSVTSIEKSAFYNCTNLQTITFNGTIEQWQAVEKVSGWKYNVPATKVICSNGEVKI